MRRFCLAALFFLLLGQGIAARATPFFARTYHLSCQTCHSGFPRLNAFGLAFRANNFRMPGAETSAPLAWQKTIPLAVQVEPVYQRFSPGANKAEFTDTQILAGGLLTRTTAFYLHHSLWIDATPTDFPSYEVWVQQVLNERHKVMLKAGQFELPYAYSPFINLVSWFQPLLFTAGLQGNDVVLGGTMRGLQLSGLIADQARLSIAYGAPALDAPGNTVGRREFFGEFHDLFLRLSNKDLDRNIGSFVYFTDQTRDPNKPKPIDHGYRFGLDGNYFLRNGLQFYAMAVYGEDNNPINNGRGVFRSGFVEADKMFLPWLGLNLRLEAQTLSVGGKNIYSDARVVGLRLYPVHNIRLTAEYMQGDHGNSATGLFAAVSF